MQNSGGGESCSSCRTRLGSRLHAPTCSKHSATTECKDMRICVGSGKDPFGTHCEYPEFIWELLKPESQHVGPVQPIRCRTSLGCLRRFSRQAYRQHRQKQQLGHVLRVEIGPTGKRAVRPVFDFDFEPSACEHEHIAND